MSIMFTLHSSSGYDNPADAADGVRRKWGSNLNLAENGDLEFKKKYFSIFFCFLFFRFLADCAPKGGKSEENGIYLGG